MHNHPVKPEEAVLLAVREGDKIITRHGLVLAVDGLSLGPNGDPAIEVVSINPLELRHAGTSDFHNALTRRFDVPHVSHPDFLEGRVSTGYGRDTDDDVYDEEDNESQAGESGDHSLSSELVTKDAKVRAPEQFAKVVSDAKAVADYIQKAGETYSQPVGSEDVTIYILFVDGEQKGPQVDAGANIKKANGEIVSVASLIVGDVLEEGLTVSDVVPVPDLFTVNVYTIHSDK